MRGYTVNYQPRELMDAFSAAGLGDERNVVCVSGVLQRQNTSVPPHILSQFGNVSGMSLFILNTGTGSFGDPRYFIVTPGPTTVSRGGDITIGGSLFGAPIDDMVSKLDSYVGKKIWIRGELVESYLLPEVVGTDSSTCGTGGGIDTGAGDTAGDTTATAGGAPTCISLDPAMTSGKTLYRVAKLCPSDMGYICTPKNTLLPSSIGYTCCDRPKKYGPLGNELICQEIRNIPEDADTGNGDVDTGNGDAGDIDTGDGAGAGSFGGATGGGGYYDDGGAWTGEGAAGDATGAGTGDAVPGAAVTSSPLLAMGIIGAALAAVIGIAYYYKRRK